MLQQQLPSKQPTNEEAGTAVAQSTSAGSLVDQYLGKSVWKYFLHLLFVNAAICPLPRVICRVVLSTD